MVAPAVAKQRGHGHHPVPRPTEHRLGRDRERGAARVDDLLDGERAEDTEGHGDVDHGGDAEREKQRPRKLTCGVGEIFGGERHDTEAEKREERERHARHDVRDPRIAGERQEISIEIAERRHGEHGEDPDDDDDDHGLRSGDGL